MNLKFSGLPIIRRTLSWDNSRRSTRASWDAYSRVVDELTWWHCLDLVNLYAVVAVWHVWLYKRKWQEPPKNGSLDTKSTERSRNDRNHQVQHGRCYWSLLIVRTVDREWMHASDMRMWSESVRGLWSQGCSSRCCPESAARAAEQNCTWVVRK